MNNIAILGAGGFAREVRLIIDNTFNYPFIKEVIYLSDDIDQHGIIYNNTLCKTNIEGFKHDNFYYVCGVGSPKLKRKFVERVNKIGLPPINKLLHKSVEYGTEIFINEGTVICSNTSLTCNIKIGKHVAINLNCTIGHDVVIEDYCNLSPGVNVSGYVYLEEGVDIGTGAVILPKVRIGKNSIIGAGAVVNKDIPPNSVAVGVPAKVIKSL